MKSTALFVVLALCLVVLSPSVLAYSFTINATCQEDFCIEGQSMQWDIDLQNRGDKKFSITSIKLFDETNQQILAGQNYTYDPFNTDYGDYIRLHIGEDKEVLLASEVPSPSPENEILYYPCFTIDKGTRDLPQTDFPYTGEYLNEQCFKNNEPLKVYQCLENRHCPQDSTCMETRCVKLSCGECQHATNHSCQDHECCSSHQCSSTQDCVDHKCVNLKCAYNEQPFNNTCIPLECEIYQGYKNNSCVPLLCDADEGYINHSCRIITCRDDEHLLNHTCQKLNCAFDHYAEDNKCKPLGCKHDETFVDHTCVPLTCNFFFKKIANNCVLDRQIIFRFSLEFLIIILIVLFFLLDLKKYESQKSQVGMQDLESVPPQPNEALPGENTEAKSTNSSDAKKENTKKNRRAKKQPTLPKRKPKQKKKAQIKIKKMLKKRLEQKKSPKKIKI